MTDGDTATGFERVLPVRRRHGDRNAGLPDVETPHAVDQRDLLDRWVHSQRIVAVAPEAVHSGIFPDIRAIAPGLTQLEVVDVWRRAVLEGEDQLMPGAIKLPHAAV